MPTLDHDVSDRTRVSIVLLTIALLLQACGTDTTDASPTTASTITSSTPTGTHESPAQWDYVALGSSFTGWASWPETYAAYIEEDLGVEVVYHERTINKARSQRVLELIRSDEELRRLLAEAEVITIGAFFGEWEPHVMTYARGGDCGGSDNEDCLREILNTTVQNTEAVFDELVELRGPDEALISTFKIGTALVELFCEWGSECWEVLAGYFIELWDAVERIALERDIRVVNALEALHAPGVFEAPMNQDYLQPDRIHLSEEGSSIVANLLRDLGYDLAAPGD